MENKNYNKRKKKCNKHNKKEELKPSKLSLIVVTFPRFP